MLWAESSRLDRRRRNLEEGVLAWVAASNTIQGLDTTNPSVQLLL